VNWIWRVTRSGRIERGTETETEPGFGATPCEFSGRFDMEITGRMRFVAATLAPGGQRSDLLPETNQSFPAESKDRATRSDKHVRMEKSSEWKARLSGFVAGAEEPSQSQRLSRSFVGAKSPINPTAPRTVAGKWQLTCWLL
jgi:hypothetical protein